MSSVFVESAASGFVKVFPLAATFAIIKKEGAGMKIGDWMFALACIALIAMFVAASVYEVLQFCEALQ